MVNSRAQEIHPQVTIAKIISQPSALSEAEVIEFVRSYSTQPASSQAYRMIKQKPTLETLCTLASNTQTYMPPEHEGLIEDILIKREVPSEETKKEITDCIVEAIVQIEKAAATISNRVLAPRGAHSERLSSQVHESNRMFAF